MENPECSVFGGYSGTKKLQLCLNVSIYFSNFFFFKNERTANSRVFFFNILCKKFYQTAWDEGHDSILANKARGG